MILSASDIKAVLTGDPVIRLVAKALIVDGKPKLGNGSGVVIYIDRYPIVDEFQARWKIWIIDYDNEPIDLILQQMRALLPGFAVISDGVITEAETVEIRSEDTQRKPEQQTQSIVNFSAFEKRFQDLVESIQDRMLLVGPGRAGKDGRDGVDGRDGRDGRDLVATDTKLGDLLDVDDEGAKEGQFLMFDGIRWVARFIPQVYKYAGGGGGTGGGEGGGIADVPSDGNYYVRKNGQWFTLVSALQELGIDAGNADSP